MKARKHGHARKKRSSMYRRWTSIKSRCTNPNDPAWVYYGARGITMCERWLEFANFLSDLGQPPTPKHTIERIDNDRGYEPGNCKWATRSEQAFNRRPMARTEQAKCEQCGTEIMKFRAAHRFCSQQCRGLYNYYHHRKQQLQLHGWRKPKPTA